MSVREYKCPCCGGEIEALETTIATECPYCGSPAILSGQVSGALKPDIIIPFKINKEKAKSIYQEFCKGKGLLPKEFLSEQKLEKIRGIYVPYWLFSCTVDGCVNFEGIRVKKWRDSRYEYTQRDFYLLLREGKAYFEHIPVDGSLTMDNTHMESIEPYDFGEFVSFEETYLSGYDAEKYDVTEQECEPRANERIKKSFEDCLKETANEGRYITVFPKESHINCRDGKVKYALLPVWEIDIEYEEKVYTYIVNGQTGKIAGDFPVSSGRLITRFLGAFSGSAAAIFFILNILRLVLSLI